MTAEPLSDAEFDRLMAALDLRPAPDRIAVAVSGGSDSLALVLLAASWAERHGIELTALTVDHGLRQESASEAISSVASTCGHPPAARTVWKPVSPMPIEATQPGPLILVLKAT